jgi:hypothetical protein
VGPTRGGETMAAARAVGVVAGRGELVGSRAPAALDDQHDVLAGCADGGQHVLELWAPLLGLPVRHDVRAAFRRAILAGTDATAPDAPGEATPRAVRPPRLPWATFCLLARALAQGAAGEAPARCGAPPARAGQGTAPEHRVVVIEHTDRATARLGREGGQCQSPLGEVSGGGSRRPVGRAELTAFFFLHRGHVRGRGGRRFHGRGRVPARDHSLGQGGSRAPEGREP